MLPKQHRLSGSHIPSLIRTGRRISNHLASLIYKDEIHNLQPATVTVIVPIRLSKKAVERNRTKRLFREAIQQQLPYLKQGFEVIIMSKKILKQEKMIEIVPEVKDLLLKANLLLLK